MQKNIKIVFIPAKQCTKFDGVELLIITVNREFGRILMPFQRKPQQNISTQRTKQQNNSEGN